MRKIPAMIVLLLTGIVLMSGCSKEILYPGISYPSTYNYTPGRFVWHDLITSNPDSSKKFYEKVFGWKIEAVSPPETGYWLIKNKNEVIGGMLKDPDYKGTSYHTEWICSMSAPDLYKTVKKCIAGGGSVVKNPYTVNGRGTMAVVKDNQGAVFALIHSRDGDPFYREAVLNSWLWMELWSDDPEASSSFYKGLTGYSCEKNEVDGKDYWVFRDNTRMASSMLKNPLEGAASSWVSYIRVSDLNTVMETSKASGAIILLEPSPLIRKGSVAVIMDPGGAIFCIQKWPVE